MTISDILGCAVSVISILFVSIVIPVFGPLLFSLLAPLPFLFYFSKLGPENGLKVNLSAILILGIVTWFLGQPHLVILFIEYGIAGFILSELFRRDLSYSATIFWGTLLMLIVVSGFLFFITIAEGATPLEIADKYLQTIFDTIISTYEKDGSHPEMVAQLKKAGPVIIKEIGEIYQKYYPSFIVVGTGIIVWFNVVVSKPLFRRKGIRYPDLGRADMWRAPEPLVWGLIVAGFVKVLSISALDFAATNALIIISVIYAFHGLSIVLFFFNKYKVPALIRFIVYLIIVLQQLPVFLAVLGLFDQWIDFRKIHSRARTTE